MLQINPIYLNFYFIVFDIGKIPCLLIAITDVDFPLIVHPRIYIFFFHIYIAFANWISILIAMIHGICFRLITL